MAKVKQNRTPFYNFLIAPQFRIWRHLCFALAIVSISLNYALPIGELQILYHSIFPVYLATLILSYLLTSYLNFYYLIPHYLLKKKYLSYLGYLSFSIVPLLIVQHYLEYFFLPILGAEMESVYNFNNGLILILDLLANFFLNLIAFIGCSVTILLKHWIAESQLVHQLERQRLQTEVEHLKEQVNPDFLFHSLDRIAALEKEDANQATTMLINLSRLLRYQLYDCNHQQVFLTSEIQYLTNYLNLEQLYHSNMQYTILADGEVKRALLPPLLFIPFVQYIVNAIKDTSAKANIHLHFESDDDYIYFTCKSDNYQSTQNINPDSPVFQSISQRIRLLFFTNYNLEIQSVPGTSCTINLQLEI